MATASRSRSQKEIDVIAPDSLRVPKAMQSSYDAVTALTDGICVERLGPEYRDLARGMTAALCRKRPSPIASGQPRTWAAGVLSLLGRINFLTDRSVEPTMAMADLAGYLGVGQSTMQAKAATIQKALGADRLSGKWQLPSLARRNPLVWMASVDGFLIDLRSMPTDIQEIALAKGLIPSIPDDEI